MFINNCNLRKRLGMSKLMEANTGDGNAGAGTGEGPINNKGGIFERSRSVIDFRAIFVLLSKKIRHKEPDLRFPGPYRSSDLRIPGTVQKDVEMQYLFLSFFDRPYNGCGKEKV